MAGWRPRLNGHDFEQALGDSEGQGSLTCCSPCGCRVRHDGATEQQVTFFSPTSATEGSGHFFLEVVLFWFGFFLGRTGKR